jgi:uncharacterized protein with FMN-binding domain
MQESASKRKEIITTVSVLAVIIVLVLVIVLTDKKTNNNSVATTKATTSTSKSASSSTTSSASTATYKDGTYMATGSYNSPGGEETLDVSVTLASGDITATTATSHPTDAEAGAYQSQFISGYKQKVIGKAISTLKLSSVSGSSLTSQGFNEAISKIKQQAQA